MGCPRCEVVYFGPRCVVFDGPHKFCHTCGRNRSTHSKAPKLVVIEGGTSMRDEIERLIANLEMAEARAYQGSAHLEPAYRDSYRFGCLSAVVENAAKDLRRLLRRESEMAAERDALDEKVVRS